MKYQLIIGLLMLFCIKGLAQEYKAENYQTTLERTGDGARLNFKSKDHSFSLSIAAKKIEPQQVQYLNVDNTVLQYQHIPVPQKVDFNALSDEQKKENLLGYMKYEMDYVKETLKQQNLNESYEFVNLGSQLFLSWTYQMPATYKTVHHQCYLVPICFDHVLVLNSPVDNEKTIAEARAFLTKIGNSLSFN